MTQIRTVKAVALTKVAKLNPRSFSEAVCDDDLVSFVPMKYVEEESGRLNSAEVKQWQDVKKGYTPFQNGDVIFAKITPCMENGKYALATNLHNGRAAGSTEFHVFRPTADLDSKYLLFFLLSPEVRREAKRNMRGAAGQLRVPPIFFEELQIPVPPLDEQQRIVAEIEKQFTRLDAGVASLKRVEAALKRYRASVLKAACEGRLVSTEAELARKENRSYETGEQLLQRILKERREKWNGKGKHKEPATPETSQLSPTPEGWTWATLDAVAEIKGGITKDQKRKHTAPARSVPYLRVANVQRGYLELNKVKEIVATEDEIQELALKPGDILFNEGGDRDKLGRGWVWNEELPECIHQNHVFRARPLCDGVKSKTDFLVCEYLRAAILFRRGQAHNKSRLYQHDKVEEASGADCSARRADAYRRRDRSPIIGDRRIGDDNIH